MLAAISLAPIVKTTVETNLRQAKILVALKNCVDVPGAR
jgi:hypothetical protein